MPQSLNYIVKLVHLSRQKRQSFSFENYLLSRHRRYRPLSEYWSQPTNRDLYNANYGVDYNSNRFENCIEFPQSRGRAEVNEDVKLNRVGLYRMLWCLYWFLWECNFIKTRFWWALHLSLFCCYCSMYLRFGRIDFILQQ